MLIKKLVILVFFLLCKVSSQVENDIDRLEGYILNKTTEKYLTNRDGSIVMRINVWGHVVSPGVHLVSDGTDFATLLSIVGGPRVGANLKKVRLYREIPDKNGRVVYNIDLNEFIKTGSRSNFIRINPNDTIIIPRKSTDIIIDQIGTINTIFSLVMIYLQIRYLTN